MDFVASCKNQKDDKPCTMNFCHKCLLNRLDTFMCFFTFIFFSYIYIYRYTPTHQVHICVFIWLERDVCMVFHAIGLFDYELDTERRQKKCQCWRTGIVQSAEAFAIAVSACKCLFPEL